MLTLKNKTTSDITFPADCVLEKELGIDEITSLNHTNLNIKLREGQSIDQYHLNSHNNGLLYVARNSCISSPYVGKSKSHMIAIGGKVFDTKGVFRSRGDSCKLCELVIRRMLRLSGGAINNTIGPSMESQGVDRNPGKIIYGGDERVDHTYNATIARDVVRGIKNVGNPLYLFLAALIGQQNQLAQGSYDIVVKLKFNPHDRTLRMRDRQVFNGASASMRESILNGGDVFLQISKRINAGKSAIGYRLLVEHKRASCEDTTDNDKFLMSSSYYIYANEMSFISNDFGEREMRKIADLTLLYGHNFSEVGLLASILISNGSLWSAEVDYRILSFPVPNYTGVDDLPVFEDLTLVSGCSSLHRYSSPGRYISPDVNHSIAAVAKLMCSSVIMPGSVVALQEGRDVKVGYFFVTLSGGVYQAVIVGESIDVDTSGKLKAPIVLAKTRSMDTLEKKLLLMMARGELATVLNQSYFPVYSSYSLVRNLTVNYIDEVINFAGLNKVAVNRDLIHEPGKRMILNRKMREFKQLTGSSAENPVDILRDIYSKLKKDNLFCIPKLPLLSSIDNFLKYGVAFASEDSFFDIRETFGHYPHLYKMFILSHSAHVNYVPKFEKATPSVFTVQKHINKKGGGRMTLRLTHTLDEYPNGFHITTRDTIAKRLPSVLAKICQASIGDISQNELKLQQKSTEVSLSIGSLTDEEESKWT